MARMMKVRRPTTAEIQQLNKRILKLSDLHQRRRAESLMLYGMGLNPLEIAVAQSVHPNTVSKDLHAFEQLDLEAVRQLRGAVHLVTLQLNKKLRLPNWQNNRPKRRERRMDDGRCGNCVFICSSNLL